MLAQFDQGLAVRGQRIKTMIDTMATLAGRPDQDWMKSIRAEKYHRREPGHRLRPSPRGDPAGCARG